MGRQRVIITKSATDIMNESGDYMMIFYHNITNLDYFLSERDFLFANTVNKYSLFGYLDDKFKYDGSNFEFLLEYPDLDKYAFWTQTVNPWLAPSDSNIGYIDRGKTLVEEKRFAGLTKNTGLNTYMDGNPDGYWYYSVGSRTNWGNSNIMPGCYTSYTPPIHAIRIWVRVPRLEFIQSLKFLKHTCKYQSHYFVSHSLSLYVLLIF